jgi:outer membrane protein with beta-barrel domain
MRAAFALSCLLALPAAAGAQVSADGMVREPRVMLEARGGVNVPTFDISDAVDAGPSFGIGADFRVAPKVYLMGDLDLGFHSGASLPGGGEGPDVKVYHYMAKLGYELVPAAGDSRWSLVVNAGAGALTFDADGPGSNTYPAINVGAKIGYRLTPRLDLVLSPQGDIAFTKDAEVGTTNAWVWPFTAGVRARI